MRPPSIPCQLDSDTLNKQDGKPTKDKSYLPAKSPIIRLKTYFLATALARSANPSLRLNFASSMTPMGQRSITARHEAAFELTSIGITGEIGGPGDVGVARMISRRDGIDTQSADHGRVTQC